MVIYQDHYKRGGKEIQAERILKWKALPVQNSQAYRILTHSRKNLAKKLSWVTMGFAHTEENRNSKTPNIPELEKTFCNTLFQNGFSTGFSQCFYIHPRAIFKPFPWRLDQWERIRTRRRTDRKQGTVWY